MAELTVREFASLGGKARSKKLSAQRRRESARKAAAARWGKPYLPEPTIPKDTKA